MPGGKANAKWTGWLDTFAGFVKNHTILPNGNPIPMLMRIFHENTGNWYWWANYTGGSTPQQFKDAFNYTRSYLVDYHGLHNLLFVYAPSKPYSYYGNNVNEYGTDRYPGNDNIDICGFDAYDTNDFHEELLNNTKLVIDFAKANNKIPTISEFGVRDGTQNTNIESWWMSAVYNPIYNDSEARYVAYMTSWQDLSTSMWWTPLPTNVTYTSFVQLHKEKNILWQSSVPAFFQC